LTPIVQKCSYFCFDIAESLQKNEDIFNAVCTKKVGETEKHGDEEDKEQSSNVTTKEAFGAFKRVSEYIDHTAYLKK
jgi:hypothetical protein